jgi:hypothetical protein
MGASGMGKSTLAVALTLHGCRVAGDDVVLLDPSNGSVIAAPRCIHLDARSQRLLRGLGLQLPEAAVTGGFLSAGDFGTGRLPFQKARHLILLEGKDNRRPRLEPLTQAEMTALLFDPSRSTGLTAAERLDGLVTLVSGTQCHRLVRGNLTETLSLLASRFCPPQTPTIGNDRMGQTLECSET